MERYEIVVDDEGNYCGLIPSENGSVVKLADAQAAVDLAKAEGAAEVRKVIQQRLIDVRLARSVARLSFAQDEYDAQISALESILKQCEEPFSSNNENGLDLQATVEALQRERDEAVLLRDHNLRRCEALDSKYKKVLAALNAEREKVKGLESEGVKLFEWRLALHSLTPGGSEFCTPDACEQWVRKIRTSQHEYIIEQIKQRKGLQTRLSQLQAMVRALPVVRIDLNGAYHDTLLARPEDDAVKELLRYRATLDATTPAPMDAAETHDRMFNHADRHPEAL